LTESQAVATVRTAALVNGAAALNTLARYAVDPRRRVQRELIKSWEYFDPIEYADKVLADAPLDNGQVFVTNTTLLTALPRLHRARDVSIGADQRLNLTQLANIPHLTRVWIHHGFTGSLKHLIQHVDLSLIQLCAEQKRLDLDVFTSLPNLTFLNVSDLSADQDLAAIIELTGLADLGLGGVSVDSDIFANLPALISLAISSPSSWDPDALAPLSRLERLELTGTFEPVGGLVRLAGQLSQMSHFSQLHLGSCRWVTDLEPLRRLPSLRGLDICDTPVADLAPLANRFRLQWLRIGRIDHVLDLTPLRDLPDLEVLLIVDHAPGIDLTPLQGKRMTVHLSRRIPLSEITRPKGIRIKRF
jgi:hypothetical protein